MMLQINHKRERLEDDNDKYFIIQMLADGNKAECGYIDKSFNEQDLKSKMPYVNEIKILKVIEFKNKLQYEEYKEIYKNEINF